MNALWKVIERDPKAGRWVAVYVSLSPKGVIALSRSTWEKTGSPPAYLVLFDAANQRIGLKPADAGDKNAFPAITRGRSPGRHVNAFRMMTEQRLVLKHGLRFTDVEIDPDGILTLDLRTAVVNNASIARQLRQPRASLPARPEPL